MISIAVLRPRNSRLLALALLLCASPAAAADEDAQLWATLSASGEVARGVDLGLEWIARFSGERDRLYEMEMGFMLGTEVARGLTFSAGYVRVPSYAGGGVTRVEDRLRQQVSADLVAIGRGRLSGRVRLEQRFRGGGEMGLRLRPQFAFSLPLGRKGRTSLRASHESFVPLNSTTWGQQPGYERMRNFIGLRRTLSGKVSVEGGYLNQFGPRGRDRVDHVLALGLAAGF